MKRFGDPHKVLSTYQSKNRKGPQVRQEDMQAYR